MMTTDGFLDKTWFNRTYWTHGERWPGYYFRTDFPTLDEDNWKCFVNATWDRASGEWTMEKEPMMLLMRMKRLHLNVLLLYLSQNMIQ